MLCKYRITIIKPQIKLIMTPKHFIPRLVCAASVIILFGLSCKKETKKTEDASQSEQTATTVSTSANAYFILNNAFDVLFANGIPDEESERTGNISDRKYGCATVTASPSGLTGFPKTVVVDFGSGCTLRGYTGKGSVSFVLDKWIFIPGTTITPQFHNFSVNGYSIEGDYTITTISATEFKVEIIDGVVTSPDNNVFHLKGTQYYTQTKGAATPFVFGDDAYSITGDINTSSYLGEIKGTITSALIKDVSCFNINKGAIAFSDVNNITAVLDFGDGTCDNKATIKVGSFVFPVTLPF